MNLIFIIGAVYGSNSLPVEIKKIENILTSNCLLGKPKLLIIQACQGEDLQKAELVKILFNFLNPSFKKFNFFFSSYLYIYF